jgi:acyl-CoA synthetase (AMP-forming)/AMP-acid ligase II
MSNRLPETMPSLLRVRRRDDADREAVVMPDVSISYADLDDASAAVAARLVRAGVGKSTRVGLLAQNSIEWVVTALAVTRVGGVLVPLSTLLRPPELQAQLQIADVTHLIAARQFRGRSYLEEIDTIASDVPLLRDVWPLDDLPEAAVDAADVEVLESSVQPDDDLVVLFTSGSTGAPKGVIHTHGGALRATAAGIDVRFVRPGERLYVPMPLFWTGGFGTGLLSALVAGATLLTEAEPEPVRTLEFLQRERVTLFRGWPDQAAKLAAHPAFVDYDLSTLRDGSLPALLPPERRPPPGARPNIFGMTETFGPYCSDPLDQNMPPDKWGSCGRPFPSMEVRVSDEGEIWLRGPNVMRGMCGRADAAVFTDDGWYRTGDLGRLDDDGYLWYLGRIDDMFKVKGATVYPSEVEAALRSIDGVRHAHVAEVDGEVGALVVSDATVDEIASAVKERLSAFKVPSRWLVSPDAEVVPLMVTGKVDKAALRSLLVKGSK